MRIFRDWTSAALLASAATFAGAQGPPVPMTPQLEMLAISPGNPLHTFPFVRVLEMAQGQRCRTDFPSWKLWINDWTIPMRVGTLQPPLAALAVVSDATARDFNSELQTFQPRLAISRWTDTNRSGPSDRELHLLSARPVLSSAVLGTQRNELSSIFPPIKVELVTQPRSLDEEIDDVPRRSEIALLLIPATLREEDKSGAAPPPMVTKGRTVVTRRR